MKSLNDKRSTNERQDQAAYHWMMDRDDLLTVLFAAPENAAHADLRDVVAAYSDEELLEPIKFFSGPKTLVDVPRIDFAWLVMSDRIHHRGQWSVYLRMADAKVPSIYGPSADEPWF